MFRIYINILNFFNCAFFLSFIAKKVPSKTNLARWPPERLIPLSPTIVLSPYGSRLKSLFNWHTLTTRSYRI